MITLYRFDKKADGRIMIRLAPALQGAGRTLLAPRSSILGGWQGLRATRETTLHKTFMIIITYLGGKN